MLPDSSGAQQALSPTSLFADLPAPQPVSCPRCRCAVTPDPFGYFDCVCGWEGPGDPLEAARGLSAWVTSLDRTLATRQSRRLLANGGRGLQFNLFSGIAQGIVATFLWLGLAAAAGGAVVLLVYSILTQAGLGVVLAVLVMLFFVVGFLGLRLRLRGLRVTRQRLPALFAAIDAAQAQAGAPRAQSVYLTPGSETFVAHRFPLMRLFFPERVLVLGMAAVPLMSEQALGAVLTHEFGHFRYGDTGLSRYIGSVLHVYHSLLDIAGESTGSLAPMRGSLTLVVRVVVGTLLLPLNVLWLGGYLVHLRWHRVGEFLADRHAVEAYGPDAFAEGLSAVIVAGRTLRQGRVRVEGNNLYAALRAHYAAIPPGPMGQLRREALQGYHSLEHTHPSTPDRIRAAYTRWAAGARPMTASSPARDLFATPEGSADALEEELTALLFSKRHKRAE